VRRYERVRFRGRERYGYEILDDALKHSVARYGPYKVEPVTTEMSIARLRQQVLKGDLINVVVFPVGLKEIDEGLIPIDIPLDKGLHGYRIAFIRATDQDRMCRVRDIAGLRQLRIGTGEQWAEAPIYKYNGIHPLTARNSELLLPMLENGRFDLFPRGIAQLVSEYDSYKNQYPAWRSTGICSCTSRTRRIPFCRPGQRFLRLNGAESPRAHDVICKAGMIDWQSRRAGTQGWIRA
jgi:hypothetical protein